MAKQITQKQMTQWGSNIGAIIYAIEIVLGIVGIILFFTTHASNVIIICGIAVAVAALVNYVIAGQQIMGLVLGAILGMLLAGSTGIGLCVGACFVGLILGAFGAFRWYVVKHNL